VRKRKNISGHSSAAGFTFLELAVVLAILVSISGLTVIWLGNFLAARTVYSDAMTLSSTARLAGELAGARGINVRFYMDLSNNSYWLAEYTEAGVYVPSTAVKQQVLTEKTGIKEFNTPRSALTAQDSSVSSDFVTFYPDGSAEPARLVLEDNKGNIYTIYFSHTTGSVKVFPGDYTYSASSGIAQ